MVSPGRMLVRLVKVTVNGTGEQPITALKWAATGTHTLSVKPTKQLAGVPSERVPGVVPSSST